ncbi:MAG: glycosyltransferase [Phycisphaerales bacterium]|nr:glycosyltransferase [Phycisphaerales bacterium]
MTSISIIMPARNTERTIADSIQSVLSQKEVGELIIVDDGSTDNTRRIITNFHDRRIIVIDGPQRGFAAAFNTALAAVQCEYFAQCDADDLFIAGRLKHQLEWLTKNDNYCAISGGYQTITPAGKIIADLACGQGEFEATNQLVNGKTVTTLCSWLIRSDILRSVAPMREWFVTGPDLDFQFRIAQVGRIWHHPTLVYQYRLHDNSVTHQSSDLRREFFDQQATLFALQRLERESDDLEDGNPPILPHECDMTRVKGRAKAQAVGQCIGSAWSAYEGGERWKGIRIAARAISISPTDFRGWKSVCIMLIRILKKKNNL